MTVERISRRNRINSRKSTGPRTIAGKARVARNAVRHGATAKPDPESIATWLSIILDKPDIQLGDLFPEDDLHYRATVLAEAEACLVPAQQALSEFETAAHESDPELQAAVPEPHDVSKKLRAGSLSLDEFNSALLHFKSRAEYEKTQLKERRLLQRYLAEAHSKRRKAFAAWLEISQRVPEIA